MMRKLRLAACAAAAVFGLCAEASVITNWVYVVTNVYTREVVVITNKVKNTHTNYYYTNHVSTVSNHYDVTYKTNVNTTLNYDVSQMAIGIVSNHAERALYLSLRAGDHADSASNSALASQSYSIASLNEAERAKSFADQAHGQVQPIIDEGTRQLNRVSAEGLAQVDRVNMAGSGRVADVNRAGASAVQSINERQSWLEDNFGKMVTNVTVNVTTNISVDDIDMSYPYVSTGGTRYDNVIISPYGTNSCVSAYPRKSTSYNTYYASTVYKITLYHRKDDNTVWEFVPSHVDYNADGIRLHFVPRNPSFIPYISQGSSLHGKMQVPEYMYWQNGTLYFKVNVYGDDNTIVSWAIFTLSQEEFPESIPLSVTEEQSVGKPMGIKKRHNYGSRDYSLAYIRTFERYYIRDIPLVFPIHASDFHQPVVSWMRMGPMLSTSLEIYNCISSISNWVENVFQKKNIGE